MISRRNFNFGSLFVLVSRCFAQEKQPTRQMVKIEGSDVRLFSSKDLYRLEFMHRPKVVIGKQKLNRLFILDLDKKTYATRPYEPWFSKASITGSVRKSGEPRIPTSDLPLLPFDPTLFEIPEGFVKAK